MQRCVCMRVCVCTLSSGGVVGVAVVWWVWQWCGGCGSGVVAVAVVWWVWQWRGGCGSGVVGVAVVWWVWQCSSCCPLWWILMLATPAKWKVFSVICVPGSPMLWAPTAPTAVPSNTTTSRGTVHVTSPPLLLYTLSSLHKSPGAATNESGCASGCIQHELSKSPGTATNESGCP